jgi:hypothetical protein
MFFIDQIVYGLTGALCYIVLLSACSAIIIWAFKRVTYSIYFDLNNGYFHSKNKRNTENIKICDIDSLHVVRKWVFGGNTNYKSYELLLILKEGPKVLVVDHSAGNVIKKDAERIAAHLKVPWSYSVYK